jgi:hypothetical protein
LDPRMDSGSGSISEKNEVNMNANFEIFHR